MFVDQIRNIYRTFFDKRTGLLKDAALSFVFCRWTPKLSNKGLSCHLVLTSR